VAMIVVISVIVGKNTTITKKDAKTAQINIIKE